MHVIWIYSRQSQCLNHQWLKQWTSKSLEPPGPCAVNGCCTPRKNATKIWDCFCPAKPPPASTSRLQEPGSVPRYTEPPPVSSAWNSGHNLSSTMYPRGRFNRGVQLSDAKTDVKPYLPFSPPICWITCVCKGVFTKGKDVSSYLLAFFPC